MGLEKFTKIPPERQQLFYEENEVTQENTQQIAEKENVILQLKELPA